MRSARAEVAQAQALAAEKIVRAPFAGRLGLRVVDQGQYLPAGTTIVTLQALDPLYVDFYVPQQSLAEVHIGETALKARRVVGQHKDRARLAETDHPYARGYVNRARETIPA